MRTDRQRHNAQREGLKARARRGTTQSINLAPWRETTAKNERATQAEAHKRYLIVMDIYPLSSRTGGTGGIVSISLGLSQSTGGKMNYIERMLEEREELKNRMYKLTNKLNDKKYIEEIGERKTGLLIAQYNAMTTYGQILNLRIQEETTTQEQAKQVNDNQH